MPSPTQPRIFGATACSAVVQRSGVPEESETPAPAARVKRRRAKMSTAKRRRSCSPPANRQRIRSSPPAASSPYFPPELIPEVASRLTSLQDFFALRAACRAYRALLPLTSSHLASQAPLILVDSGSTPLSYALFHPTIRRIHRFRLSRSPLADNGYCVSTKLHPIGCRLAVCETEYMLPGGPPTHTSFSIVHLLTGERTCISSPPDRVCRVLLSGDLVLTFNWNSPQAIQYCHLEAADWRLAAITQPYSILDLLYVNGVLYALVVGDLGCRLAAVELSENEGSVELVILGGCWDDNSPWAHLAAHLAGCCGELLLVDLVDSERQMYHVFQWKFREARWARVTSLGGCTLFFANDHFVGCLGPDHRGIRGDSIYIIEDNCGGWYEYSLLDGSLTRSYPKCSRGEASSEIWAFTWVLPSMG